MKRLFVTLSAFCAALGAWCAELPVLQFRLESDHTSSDEAWARTYAMLRKVPELCDEIWFGTGFGMPRLDTHRANAARIRRAMEDVRRLGWSPALQIQATIGHGGPFTEGRDYSGRDWTGWTGSTGREDKCCNCPRDPRFLRYMREMSRIYAELHPASVWIDDDLRIDNHYPASRGSLDGCWCDGCIAAFNAEIGGKWTRQTLEKAARKDAKSCEGTVPVGFAGDFDCERLYRFAQTGVPVLFGPGKPCGKIAAGDVSFNRCKETSASVQKLRDSLDERVGGTPAVLESPFVGMMLPRVTANGELRNVAILGVRLDEQGPVRLRLRGVPQRVTKAVWREIRREPVSLPISREGVVCRVEVPSVGVWNGGYLEFD